jgi:hypothetical protein
LCGGEGDPVDVLAGVEAERGREVGLAGAGRAEEADIGVLLDPRPLRSVNAREDRVNLERFLPENLYRWTPDELEFGAHNGPWFLIGDVTAEQP